MLSGEADQAMDGSNPAPGVYTMDDVGIMRSGSDLVLAGLPGGGFVVAWREGTEVDDKDVQAKIYDDAGAFVTSFQVNASSSLDQNSIAITTLANGRFVVSWAETEGFDSLSQARVFESDGTAVTGDITLTGTGFNADLAPLGNGFVAKEGLSEYENPMRDFPTFLAAISTGRCIYPNRYN